MKRIELILAILAICLLSSCVTANTTLLVVPEEGLDTTTKASGTLGARSEDGLQMVAGADYFDQANVQFMVSLASIDGGSFTFEERNIALYGGNVDTGKWELIDRWDSELFRNSEKAKANAAIVANGIIGTLFFIDAILNPDSTTFYYEVPLYYGHGYRGPWSYSYWGPTVEISGSGAIGAGFIALSTIESAIVLSQLSDMYQAELDRTLLQSTVITPSTPAVGNVTFTNLPKYPDYRLAYEDGSRDMEFTFSRSDREDLLHPWRDRSTTRLAVNYSYTFATRRNSLTFNILPPSYLGGFFGMSFYPSVMGSNLPGTVGGIFGLNWKTAPHTWIQGGIELYDIRESEDIGLLALMGVNFCFNWISLYGGAVFDVNGRSWYAEAGLGVAF